MGQPRIDHASRHADRQRVVRRQRRLQVDRDVHAPERRSSLHLWVRLFQRHSPLLLLVTWTVLLGTAIAAVTAIVDPDVSVQSPSMQAKVGASANLPQQFAAQSDHLPVQRLTKQRQKSRRQATEPGSPLSAGGALLVSCAGGCLLLSRCLQPQSAARGRRRTGAKLASELQSMVHQDAAAPLSAEAETAAEAPTRRAAQSRWPMDSTIMPLQSSPQPTSASPGVEAGPSLPVSPVSILAADQSHPLDWDEPSLADNLDLRQKRPLSYWLRG
jgi:hypothetical protein